VNETARVLEGMGAEVEERIYPGFGHSVNEDEVSVARLLLQELVSKG
jgi:predicted esterase